ncbi:MAG: pilus assembly protein TadB [Hydrogenophilales bacterium 17-61-9]|nr:MAG: pilus assembly protein TadB [Hydrogenophilales bacterium 17-61-9]
MDYLFILFIVAVFFAVVLLLEGFYQLWNATRGPEIQRINQRIQSMSAGSYEGRSAFLIKKRLLSQSPAVEQVLLGIHRIHRLDRLLEQSGSTMSVAQLLAMTLLAALTALLLGLFLGLPWFVALLLALAAASLPYIAVLNKKLKRVSKIERQLPDVLDLMSRALRAGHAFPSALEMVAKEGLQPIAQEFRVVSDEVNFGIPMEDALNNLAVRVPVTDLRYFVIAVLIQRDTGGNLAELLDNLARLIRERFKLLGHIKVLSAEGRLSAWILTILPFAMIALINIINPHLMSVLWTDSLGQKLSLAAMAVMVLGVIWMWRIIKIRI